MSKFAEWMVANDKKQVSTALKIGISQSTLSDILASKQLPSLKLAYEIEKYTKGAITVYDWIDQNPAQDNAIPTTKRKRKPAKK